MQRKNNQPDSSITAKLPEEIFPLIASHLSIYSLKKLLITCSYFFHNQSIRKILIEKIHQAFLMCAGSSHTVVLHKESGIIYGLGCNDKGQLGLDYMNRKRPKTSPRCVPIPYKATFIVAGSNHTFVLAGESLFGFGSNRTSQLGLGESLHDCNVFQPQQIIIPDIPKKIFTSNGPLNSSSMVLCENNHLYVFGANDKGQLGLGDLMPRYTPTLHPFSLNTQIKDVIMGVNHTFFLTNEGIYGCGGNECGQLGFGADVKIQLTPKLIPFKEYGILPDQNNPISAGDYHTLIKAKGKIFGMGANGCSQLGLPLGVYYYIPVQIPIPDHEIVTKIQTKAATNFIWCEKNIYTFGDNSHGQSGAGTNLKTIPEPQFLEPANSVLEIISGGNHTFIVGKSKIDAYGHNQHAQLGSGEVGEDQIKPIQIKLFKFLQKLADDEKDENQKKQIVKMSL